MKGFASIFAVLTLLCLARTTSSEDPELRFLSAQLPMFPPIAQTAHVTGLVNASFLVDESGNVISATILSGPKILADETEKNIRTWKFASLPPAVRAPWKDHTTFVYAYGSDPLETLTIKMHTFRHIEINIEPPMIQ